MKIILVTDYRGFLRQGMRQFRSLDIQKVKVVLEKSGFYIEEYSYEEIINSKIEIDNEIIIYTSSQRLEYKKYIDDVLYYLNKNNKLIPRYEIFRAHENKGYQEIVKRDIGLNSLSCQYYGNLKGMENNKELIGKFPLVLKRVDGAGSSNVLKVEDYEDLVNKVKNINKPLNYLMYSIKKNIIKNFFPKKYCDDYYKEDIFLGPFILQDFVNNLKEDWKVLVFGGKYYVLNRKIRDNDFRASGSGKLSYIDPPKKVLDYAKNVYESLDVPFISLDIAYDGDKCYLIEFQGTHFGPYTLVKSDYYFTLNDHNGWEKINEKSDLEEEYAQSILSYIEKLNHHS